MNTVIGVMGGQFWYAMMWRWYAGRWIYYGMCFGDSREELIEALENNTWK